MLCNVQLKRVMRMRDYSTMHCTWLCRIRWTSWGARKRQQLATTKPLSYMFNKCCMPLIVEAPFKFIIPRNSTPRQNKMHRFVHCIRAIILFSWTNFNDSSSVNARGKYEDDAERKIVKSLEFGQLIACENLPPFFRQVSLKANAPNVPHSTYCTYKTKLYLNMKLQCHHTLESYFIFFSLSLFSS